METRTKIDLVNGIYVVEVGLSGTTTQLSPTEHEALSRFGEAIVNVGGTFEIPQDEGPALEFTLPEADRRFPSNFPVKAQFAIIDFEEVAPNAYQRAVAFRDTIKARIIAARDSWLARSVGGEIGTEIDTVPYTPVILE